MAQSLAKVLIHLIFSTKERMPVLAAPTRPLLAASLGTVGNRMRCPCMEIGCRPEHVHILCGLSRTVTLARAAEEFKTASSRWVKTRAAALRNFHWQGGYGAFSVSPSNVEEVRAYIRNQDAHHRLVTFQDEFRAFLVRHGVEFDERDVWA
jgi:REP element-mobilizing transposase RayT